MISKQSVDRIHPVMIGFDGTGLFVCLLRSDLSSQRDTSPPPVLRSRIRLLSVATTDKMRRIAVSSADESIVRVRLDSP